MKTLEAYALMAFDVDVKNRTWGDWLAAHISFMRPLHRYDGFIVLTKNYLAFRGIDVKTMEQSELIIAKHELEQIYHGYDETYSLFEVRGLGLFWKPIRLLINKNGREGYVYLIINFRWGTTDNAQWFEILKDWAS